MTPAEITITGASQGRYEARCACGWVHHFVVSWSESEIRRTPVVLEHRLDHVEGRVTGGSSGGER